MRFEELFKYLEKNKYYVFSYEDLLLLYSSESNENIKKMIDIKLLRQEPELFKENLKKRGIKVKSQFILPVIIKVEE